MRICLLFCTSLTLVSRGFARDIASQRDEGTSHVAEKVIEHPPHGPNFHQEDMSKLRDRTEDSWKFFFKTPLSRRRISCQETNRERPCQRKRSICRPIVVDVTRHVTKTQKKSGRAVYRRIDRDWRTRKLCPPARDVGVEKKTWKIEWTPIRRINKKRSLFIAKAPSKSCSPGSTRNERGECWIET